MLNNLNVDSLKVFARKLNLPKTLTRNVIIASKCELMSQSATPDAERPKALERGLDDLLIACGNRCLMRAVRV